MTTWKESIEAVRDEMKQAQDRKLLYTQKEYNNLVKFCEEYKLKLDENSYDDKVRSQ